MAKLYTKRYVAMTTKGKPLFIKIEQKSINGSGMVRSVYKTTDDLVDASKTLDRRSAQTMIDDFMVETHSTKDFAIKTVATTFELED